MSDIVMVLVSVVLLAVGGGAGYFGHLTYIKKKKDKVFEESQSILKKAEQKKEEMLLEAKKEMNRLQEEFRKEEKEMRQKMTDYEDRVVKKEDQLDKKLQKLDEERDQIETQGKELEKKAAQIEELRNKQVEELANIAKLTKEEARKLLFDQVEEESRDDILVYIRKVEDELKKESDEKAKMILAEAIQRCASDVVSETTVTLVELASDDLKGRIIGKEGRNINAFEKATGVDVIVDDTPGVVIISGFDLIRRYVAKLALEKLLQDGRIHPTSIDEAVDKAQKEVEKHIKDIGERVVYEIGVTGLHPDLIRLLGRLKFRTNFGQNLLKHSVEVAYLSSYLAEELRANVEVCKKGALLHEIGRAMNHEVEGHPSAIAKDLAKKYGMSEEIQHVIEANEGLVRANTIEAVIVQIANSVALARPGAKKEGVDAYIKRLHNIEEVAKNFAGVTQAYAVHAGKEVRIMLDTEVIDDLKAYKLAKEIASALEHDSSYAGQMKVTVIRETHVVEYAK